MTIAVWPGRVQILCDGSLIQRAVANLLGNAAKFSPMDSPILITFEQQAGCLKLLVSDQGPGIPAEFHSKIFEKFGQVQATRQNHYNSTGLGLTFCRLAVEAHGGKIGVESTVGQGSTFWFALPAPTA